MRRVTDRAAILRLKAELAGLSAVDGSTASPSEIETLVENQLRYWREPHFDRASLGRRMRELNETSTSVFIFEIRNRAVSVWKKPVFTLGPKIGDYLVRSYRERTVFYRFLIETVLARYDIGADMLLALDGDDIAAEISGVPLFAFQKDDASRKILLPDVDFFHSHWYRQPIDHIPNGDKIVKACFVGSSTGGLLSEQSIADRAYPRLRAAAHFVDSPLVEFRIARAVQCDTEATKALLERQHYFGKPMSWADQFSYRFLISIDGNGAACSRPLIALKSNATLIKYRSPFSLYYFSAMVAGRDYIDVVTDEDVEEVVKLELSSPGHFKPVAESGQRFAARYLNHTSVLDYTGALLREYGRIVNA